MPAALRIRPVVRHVKTSVIIPTWAYGRLTDSDIEAIDRATLDFASRLRPSEAEAKLPLIIPQSFRTLAGRRGRASRALFFRKNRKKVYFYRKLSLDYPLQQNGCFVLYFLGLALFSPGKDLFLPGRFAGNRPELVHQPLHNLNILITNLHVLPHQVILQFRPGAVETYTGNYLRISYRQSVDFTQGGRLAGEFKQ